MREARFEAVRTRIVRSWTSSSADPANSRVAGSFERSEYFVISNGAIICRPTIFKNAAKAYRVVSVFSVLKFGDEGTGVSSGINTAGGSCFVDCEFAFTTTGGGVGASDFGAGEEGADSVRVIPGIARSFSTTGLFDFRVTAKIKTKRAAPPAIFSLVFTGIQSQFVNRRYLPALSFCPGNLKLARRIH